MPSGSLQQNWSGHSWYAGHRPAHFTTPLPHGLSEEGSTFCHPNQPTRSPLGGSLSTLVAGPWAGCVTSVSSSSTDTQAVLCMSAGCTASSQRNRCGRPCHQFRRFFFATRPEVSLNLRIDGTVVCEIPEPGGCPPLVVALDEDKPLHHQRSIRRHGRREGESIASSQIHGAQREKLPWGQASLGTCCSCALADKNRYFTLSSESPSLWYGRKRSCSHRSKWAI